MIQLALTALPVVSSAKTDGATLTIEQSDTCVGDLVEVKVNLKNNPGIVSATLIVSFSENLKLAHAKNGDVFSALTYIPPKALSNGLNITSEARFIWSGFDIQDADIKNGTILTLYFKFTKGSKEPYQISITSENGDIVDKDMNSIILNINKTIAVDYHKSGTTLKNKKAATTSANGYTGDTYCKTCDAVLKKGKIVYKIKSIALSKTLYRYDGKVKTPAVVVKDQKNKALVLNKDYTVSYSSNRKKVGKYKAVVTFKGNYSGTKTLNFTIYNNLSAPSKMSAELYGYDDVKVSWSKVTNAKAYKVYYKKSADKAYKYNGRTTNTYVKIANLTPGVKYVFKVVPCTYVNKTYLEDDNYKTTSIYTLKKVSTPKVSKVTSSKVKITWTDINGESGYEISVSKSKNSTGKTYRTTSNSKTVTITPNKTHYYKVRAYKIVNGKYIYTNWSTVKAYK